ncbi:MAG: hypothetical protein J3K34DRAFT_398449, partial [Monoraphidium minutum]
MRISTRFNSYAASAVGIGAQWGSASRALPARGSGRRALPSQKAGAGEEPRRGLLHGQGRCLVYTAARDAHMGRCRVTPACTRGWRDARRRADGPRYAALRCAPRGAGRMGAGKGSRPQGHGAGGPAGVGGASTSAPPPPGSPGVPPPAAASG